MFTLKSAKLIVENAPKYSTIVEPFGDSGSIAFELAKRKPKTHILNIEDAMTYQLMLFLQQISSSDKSSLKNKDWVSSEEAFNKVLSINAMDGPDSFYRWYYLRKFGISDMKNMEADPVYDWVTFGKDIKSIIYELPVMNISLKVVTISNDDPISMLKSYGSDSFLILEPKKPEHVQSADSKVSGISSPFVYIKKNKSNEELILSAGGTKNKVSIISRGSVMPGRIEVMTNYDNKLEAVSDLLTTLKN